jgi:deoxyribodipyrimidine photo-lyase
VAERNRGKRSKTDEAQNEAHAAPEFLAKLADDPRVMVRGGGAPLSDGRCVVYWMQRAQRGLDNPAVDLAVKIGNELRLPVVSFFSAIGNFPHANLRHYVFLNQGFQDIEEDLAERNVSFVVRRAPNNSLEALLEEVGAAMLIGDENPCREPERWRQVLARRLRLPFWTVDADVVVPSSLFPKHQYMLHIMRPRLEAELPKYLAPLPPIRAEHAWARPRGFESFTLTDDVTAGWRNLDRSVKLVDTFTGGTHAALRRLKYFVDHQLADYSKQRNHPEIDGTSRLSPYLHFGHISPLTIALAVDKAVQEGMATKAARDSYLNELIGWRELSVNFVKYVPHYDTIECAPEWAQKTLHEHSRDRRDPTYAWAIGGVHDRPWFDRPIFGTVRYMSGKSTGKKFDSARYIAQVRSAAS